MFEGVYCKEKNSNTVHESILIDNFNNCINSAVDPQSCAENLSDSRSDEMSTANDHISDSGGGSGDAPQPLTNCVVGANVRATYAVDGKLYEAVVKKLFGKPPTIMARVRYYGYGNEESVPVNLIFNSLGQAAIDKQIKCARFENDKQTGCNGSVQKEIKWKKGMPCRALFEEKDIIYEATVLEVNDTKRTAYVEMLGYGTRYPATFRNMFESIPKLRDQQGVSAQKYIQEIMAKNTLKTGGEPSVDCNGACLKMNESNSVDFAKQVDVTSDISKEPKFQNVDEIASSESVIDGVPRTKNASNCTDVKTEVDVTSEISKRSKLAIIDEEEPISETVASGGALLKENASNCHDFEPKVNVLAESSKEPQLDDTNEIQTTASDGAQVKENKSNSIEHETEPKLNNAMSEITEVLTESHLPLSLISEEIVQPQSEAEALACLLSANYLSGYYAGYYDCIRRRQNSDQI